MHNIDTLLKDKGKELWSIGPRETAFRALEKYISGGYEI